MSAMMNGTETVGANGQLVNGSKMEPLSNLSIPGHFSESLGAGNEASDNQPMSPTSDLAGKNLAVDHMKSRYQKIEENKLENTRIPQVLRQPKKLDGEWEQMMDEKKQRQDSSVPVLREQDILALVMACTGVDSKSQYLNLMAEKEAATMPVNKQPVEKVAPPEITKTVRSMFESGNIADLNNPHKRLLTYEMTPGSGVFENEPAKLDGIVRSGVQDGEEDKIQSGLTKSLLNQWQNIATTSDIKKDGLYDEAQLLQGTTKSLLNQWSNKDTENSVALGERKPVNIRACDGTVSESRPTKRTDVIREEDSLETDKVQTGTTKNLLHQWKNIGSEEFKPNRPAIIDITEGTEGKILENEPVRRTDVIREEDLMINGEVVQSGLTKNLLNQWKSKGSEEFNIQRKPIQIAEDAGAVVENTPTRRMDVVNPMTEAPEENKIQQGFTKSLVSQWKQKDSAEFVSSKKPIVIAEDEGKILENNPVQRTDCVREDDSVPEKVVQRGTTQSLLGHWSTVGAQEFQNEKSPLVIFEGEGKIAENEPVVRSDVVRENSMCEEIDQVQSGITKSLLNQWKAKGSEEFKIDRKPIQVAEVEGTVSENQPIVRDDVIRENYVDDTSTQIKRDTTKSLREQWMNKGKEEFKKERTPIVLAEAEEKILENDPVVRTDVVREYDVQNDTEKIQRGLTRSLMRQWSSKGSEEYSRERTPIVVAEGEGTVSENQPTFREDVFREYDPNAELGQIQSGITQNLKAQYLSKSGNEFKQERAPIVLAECEGKVLENEPTVRTDVVREYDIQDGIDQVQRGTTKQLLTQWKTKGNEQFVGNKKPICIMEDEGKVLENTPVIRSDVMREFNELEITPQVEKGMTKNLLGQWKVKGNEEFKIERKPINIMEDEGKIAENEPTPNFATMNGDLYIEDKIQPGITKSLKEAWKNIGSEEFKIERPPINIAEGEDKVLENEPLVRSDVVRENEPSPEELIQRGLTKNLTKQWKAKGSEEFQILRPAINYAEGDGKIAENDPLPSGVTREEEIGVEKLIQKGLMKNLRNQYKSKASEEFTINRQPINITEGEDKVVENEPIIRSDVIREADLTFEEQSMIKKGLAKNLTNQWKTMGSESFKIDRAPINVAEDEGKTLENEPIRRSDVLREDESNVEEKIQRGFTKQLRDQWKAKCSEEFKPRKQVICILEDKGTVSENQPIKRTDVIREEDCNESELVVRGIAKNLVSDWSNKGSEFTINRPPINVAEGEDKVLENQPTRRTDVYRENDSCEEERIQRGTTKNLMSQWKNKGSEVFKIERAPINVAEGKDEVLENEPVVRTDVIREYDNLSQDRIARGLTKNLAQQWKYKGQEEFKIDRPPVNIAEDEGKIAENQPVQRADVLREYDAVAQGDTVQRGITKNLLTQWKSKGTEEFCLDRKPIVIAEDEGKISENQPALRCDAFRENDTYEEKIPLERGHAKAKVSMWQNKREDSEPRQPKEQIVIDLAEGPSVLENEPAAVSKDVVRSDSYVPDVIEAGVTMNLVRRWKTQDLEDSTPRSACSSERGVSVFLAEMEQAAGSGVYENQPVVLSDVVRETDVSAEMIPIKQTRNTRKLWSRLEQDVDRDPYASRPRQEQIRFTPPREKTPPLEDFKSYHSITLSSVNSTPSATCEPISPFTKEVTSPKPQQQPSWFPKAPSDSNKSSSKNATTLQIMPSSNAPQKNKPKQQALRPYQIRQMQQQQLQQQKLQQEQLNEQQQMPQQLQQQMLQQEQLKEQQQMSQQLQQQMLQQEQLKEQQQMSQQLQQQKQEQQRQQQMSQQLQQQKLQQEQLKEQQQMSQQLQQLQQQQQKQQQMSQQLQQQKLQQEQFKEQQQMPLAQQEHLSTEQLARHQDQQHDQTQHDQRQQQQHKQACEHDYMQDYMREYMQGQLQSEDAQGDKTLRSSTTLVFRPS